MSECVKVLRDELPYNLHIFVNSVEFIAKVIDTLKLAPEAVKIVCSTSGDSRQENQRKLGNAYPIGQPSDPAKKINFYTSTCFEGCDIFDPDGVTFIVSDGRKAHTLLDISTLFTQICGRIRDSRYKTQIVHVYSTTKYSKAVTLDEFVAATQRTLADAEKFASDINAVDEPSREKLLKKISYINEQYVRIADNRLIVEKNLANMDIVNFKISRHIYATYVNLTDELQRNGYKVTVQTYSKVVEHLAANPTARTTFRELFDEYCRLKTMTEQFFVVESPTELCAVIEQRHPLVKQAYDKLGTAKVQALKYHVGNIRRELVKGLSIGDDYKIVKMINDAFQKQTPIAKNKAKERLQEIYDTLGLQRKAKATDLAQ
ncbi:hypothetical protein [Alistipes communis]|uniref:hypothetical protein n=1 Tax=Alistipes communis TaxID=2585118 RepID=UPI001141E8E6|nr:hypothetical protein [Alistipes communis]BBL15265.1 hypothetical protein A6CPBBH3_19040 [Alistipes communis]